MPEGEAEVSVKVCEEVTTSATASEEACIAPPSFLRDLAGRHREKYQERQAMEKAAEQAAELEEARKAEEERKAQEVKDAELAAQLAREEEEEQLRNFSGDEDIARQLAAQDDRGYPQSGSGFAGGSHVPLQDFTSGGGGYSANAGDVSDEELAAQYHAMEDGEGYRAPMRTGYNDRLIDPPDERIMAYAAQLHNALLAARAAAVANAADESQAREALVSSTPAPGVRSCVSSVVPVVCLASLVVAIATLLVQGA